MPGPENFKPRPGSGRVRQFYRKNCMPCQLMKKDPTFRLRVMQSRYFNPKGRESLASVVHDYGDPFALATIYAHMSRHQESDLQKARRRYAEVPHPHSTPLVVSSAVEGEVVSQSQHELGLDEFIREGREKLLRKEMSITATTYLQAIKIRTDIDKTTKDRRMEMIKNFFAGANSEKKEIT